MKWHRFRTKTGTIYYSAHVSETIMLHVWLEKNKWNWVIAGWPSPEKEIAIFRTGRARTLKEATTQIESIIPKNDEQLVWMNL